MSNLISLVYACPLCHTIFIDAPRLRRHLLDLHSIAVPGIKTGKRRIDNADFTYVKYLGKRENPLVTKHYSCVSCFQHFPALSELEEHLKTHIIPQTIPNKRKMVETNEESHEDVINIPTSTDVFTFSPLNSRQFYQPKIPAAATRSLSSLITMMKQEQPNNVLHMLKSMKNAHLFLLEALDQPYIELPRFLWAYDEEYIEDTNELDIIHIIQFALTDFASKCNRKDDTTCNLERTFWIDRVIPIFQILGDQTGLLSFKWCEIFSQGHAEFSATIMNNQPCKARYVDGMGYGGGSQEWMVMESASGPLKENVKKSNDDSVKQLHSLVCILYSFTCHYPDASFETMKKMVAIGINLVKTTITFSTLGLNEVGDGYVYKERESCDMPTCYNDRSKWLRLFNLIINIMLLLKQQNQVHHQLRDEHDGIIEIDKTMTIRSKFKN